MTLGPVSNRSVSSQPQVQSSAPAEAAKEAKPASPAAQAQSSSKPTGLLDGFREAASGLFKADGAASVLRDAAGKAMEVTADLKSRLSGWDPAMAANSVSAAPKATAKEPLSITDPAQREKLISGSPQVNEVSKKAHNSQSCCSGAAMVNAMLADCKTPEDCKRNADALAKVADRIDVWSHMPPGVSNLKVQTALDNMSKGKMTPEDVQHLQQLTYAMNTRVQGAKNGDTINTGGVATTAALLQGAGAFKGSMPTFHESRLEGGGNHWTTTVDGKHANSQPAGVQDGTPDRMRLDAKNENWRADVSIDKSGVHATWRPTEKKDGFDPAKLGVACSADIPATRFDLSEDGSGINQLDPRQFDDHAKQAARLLKRYPQKVRLGTSS